MILTSEDLRTIQELLDYEIRIETETENDRSDYGKVRKIATIAEKVNYLLREQRDKEYEANAVEHDRLQSEIDYDDIPF